MIELASDLKNHGTTMPMASSGSPTKGLRQHDVNVFGELAGAKAMATRPRPEGRKIPSISTRCICAVASVLGVYECRLVSSNCDYGGSEIDKVQLEGLAYLC